jgi:hypothetical protein
LHHKLDPGLAEADSEYASDRLPVSFLSTFLRADLPAVPVAFVNPHLFGRGDDRHLFRLLEHPDLLSKRFHQGRRQGHYPVDQPVQLQDIGPT